MWPLSAMTAVQSTGTGAPFEPAESTGTWSRVAMAAPSSEWPNYSAKK